MTFEPPRPLLATDRCGARSRTQGACHEIANRQRSSDCLARAWRKHRDGCKSSGSQICEGSPSRTRGRSAPARRPIRCRYRTIYPVHVRRADAMFQANARCHAGPPSRRSSGSSWSPSYDSSPAIDPSSSATDSQAASDAANQAIQSLNDENALNASVAAAEAQNEATQAAAIQTEINATTDRPSSQFR
jgi:hypothetical protein